MTRIEQIYLKIASDTPEVKETDQLLTERIREAVSNSNYLDEVKDDIREAMFTGSSYGHSAGFVSGFRFAVRLFAEAFV